MSKWIDADALPKYTGYALSADEVAMAVENAPSIDICFCRECKLEWTQKCPPHRMGLIHDESDYCSYGIRKGADDE